MREILFKGKRKDNGDWIYGYYIKSRYYEGGTTHFIVDMENKYDDYDGFSLQYEINPDTLCQYMGLTDKNGKKIFEGDICHFYGGEYYSGFWETNHTCEIKSCHECFWYLENAEYVEVIGNIFDNPELIRGVEE